jgi:DNA-binding transcriptional LysR family regulator
VELRHLRYFIAVAEELHFRRAAERLWIAQPPLSQQIKQLENEVGVLLLRRTKRKVELTEAGQVFLAEARRAVAQADHAAESARRAGRGEIGHLTVGFVGSSTYTVLPPVLRAFGKDHPGVEISLRELTTAQQLAALDARQVDVGFVRAPSDGGAVARSVLMEEEFVIALPQRHRLASRARVPLAELREDPFILFPRAVAAPLHDPIVGACQHAGFSPRVVLETTQTPVMISLVAAGMGVAMVPACVQALRLPRVLYKRLKEPGPRTNVTLLWRSRDESAVVDRFVESARRSLRAMPRDQ